MISAMCLLLISFFIVNSALSIHGQNPHLNHLFSQFERVRDAVERFQCPKGWERFGGSCHFFPNTKSTPRLANETCIRYSNDSQLMEIRYLPDLFYAAYVLKMHNQQEIIVKIDSNLVKKKEKLDVLSTKDWSKWQQADEKFRQARDSYYGQNTKASVDIRRFLFTLASADSPVMGTGNEKNYAYKMGYKDFDRGENLYRVCGQLVWNTSQSDSHVFVLTTRWTSNKTMCFLSAVKRDQSYPLICQYVLDYCLANDECGRFGRCINTLSGFECSCYFFMTGSNCRSMSREAIVMIIAVAIIVVSQSYVRRESLKSLWSRIKGISTCCKTKEDDSIVHDASKKRSCFLRCLFCIVSTSIFVLLLIIPTVYHPLLLAFNLTDELNNGVSANDFQQMIIQCKNNPFIQALLITSGILVSVIVSPFLLMKQRREFNSIANALTEFLIPFKPFALTNRYEIAAIFGITIFEVLTTFNHALLNLSQFLGPHVFTELIQSFINLFIIIIKYYPLLLSLRQKNVIIRFFAFLYFMLIIAFVIYDKKSCLNLFASSKKVSDVEEAKIYMMLGKWIIGFDIFRNIHYFTLLAYIGAEVTIRFVDALTGEESKKTSTNVKRKSYRSCMRSVFNYFYPWDGQFRFVAISLCTYTTAFIFVHYLTCTLTFHALIGRSKYIQFLNGIAKSVLNIEIQDFSSRYKIILSGAITLVVVSYQLFAGMKECKKNVRKPSQNTNDNSITSESINYLKRSILCMTGGVYIVFSLILFILIIIARIPIQFESVEPLVSVILPTLLVYALVTSIIQALNSFLSKQRSENEHTVANNKINAVTVILFILTFIYNFQIGIAACFLRLLKIIFGDIISGTRIDCSSLGQPAEVSNYPCNENQTIDETASDSRDKFDVEQSRTSSVPQTQSSYRIKTTSTEDEDQLSKLGKCPTRKRSPLSLRNNLTQNQRLQREQDPAPVAIPMDEKPTRKPGNSVRARGKKAAGYSNSQEKNPLIRQNPKPDPEGGLKKTLI